MSLPNFLEPPSPEAVPVRQRYGDRDSLLTTFHVDHQAWHASDPVRCVSGNAPTIAETNAAYGRGTAEAWLTFQLAELSEYAGARDKIQPRQLRQLATLLASQYYYLKLTDFELFFSRVKLGFYGHYYGSIDPMVIAEQMREYLKDRSALIDKYEEQQRRLLRQQMATPRQLVASFERYEQLLVESILLWLGIKQHKSPPYIVPLTPPNIVQPPKFFQLCNNTPKITRCES